MKQTLIFIHGMFQNGKSWDNWVHYFTAKGYRCVVESWPLHQGEPTDLRRNVPEGLGDLRLAEVVNYYGGLICRTDRDAVLIGHSVGGLIVQSLLNKGLGSAGICISSVAPNRMLSLDWGFFKNSISIANPFKGDEPFYMSPEGFHASFCNAMTEEESNAAYEKTALHDSRNVLRDCMLADGEMELHNSNKPMLFIAAEKDQIIPAELNEKNAKAYEEGLATYKEFSNRGHYICNQPGWEEVADFSDQWLEKLPVGVGDLRSV
jgi:pimeloyl-ACP methyl ester carboxylesterase